MSEMSAKAAADRLLYIDFRLAELGSEKEELRLIGTLVDAHENELDRDALEVAITRLRQSCAGCEYFCPDEEMGAEDGLCVRLVSATGVGVRLAVPLDGSGYCHGFTAKAEG